jgi:hypothetical protein
VKRLLPVLFASSLIAMSTVTTASAATWIVKPDGSGDVPTIQAAMDTAVAGDTLIVSCGTYYEHDIQVKNGVYFTSATGNCECVTIDGQNLGRVLKCDFLEATTSIVGFTILDGNVFLTGEFGGGLYCYRSNPKFTNCAFIDNSAPAGGGAWLNLSSPVFTNCEFSDNYVCEYYPAGGGGVSISQGRPTFVNCIFSNNGSSLCCGGGVSAGADSVIFKNCLFERNMGCGAAMYVTGRVTVLENCTLVANIANGGASGIQFDYSAYASLEDCIIAFNENRTVMEWISAEPVEPLLTCCDLYGNEHGDWVSMIADQYGVRGNISEDPLFCDLAHSDFYLLPGSPCLDVDTCGTMGAYGECDYAITSVVDLPGDEGGQVNVTWHRVSFDSSGSDTVVDHYSIWRRSEASAASAEKRSSDLSDLLADPPGTWEHIYTAAASGQATYTAACPTVCDSTGGNVCWQVFFVRAHCSDPVLEFDTQPDSGYSVDDKDRPGEGWTDVTTATLGSTDAGSGLAWVDYDNDGDLDIFFSNRVDQKNQLLVNQDLTPAGFIKDTPVALQDQTNSRGCPWGDYDRDGDLDLYISNKGANKLFRNDGGGDFVDVTSSPLDDAGTGQTASWVDYDNDGDIDLYIVNNGTNRLFRNEGGGTFTDVTTGAVGDSSWGMGMGWADYDNDGDVDVYVANYDGANVLLRNEGGSVFVDATTAVLESPLPSYGAAWGDYDNDGDLDLYVNNEGANKLLRNDMGAFTDVTSYPVDNGWKGRSAAWGDYDNDGDLDLYLVNYNKENRLFRNEGCDSFSLNTPGCHWIEDGKDGFSATWADYDQDGDLDIYLVNDQGDCNRLFRNELNLDHHWLEIDPVGVLSNTDGLGTRVRMVTGEVSQMREIAGASGFASQGPLTAWFGLGTETTADTVEITWPTSGIVQVITDVPGDQRLRVIEGDVSGIISRRDIPSAFRLHPSRPNPFSAMTAIRYDLPQAERVDLAVYDVSGRLVCRVLDNRPKQAGYHTVHWNGRNTEGQRVAPGVYFCRLSAGPHTGIERILLLR